MTKKKTTILSRQQKAIIRKVAKRQEESFLRILREEKLLIILNELTEEGYDVTLTDLEEKLSQDLMAWDSVKERPEEFLEYMDSTNLGMMRHLLVNEFRRTEHIKGIHRKLNLFEEINQNPN